MNIGQYLAKVKQDSVMRELRFQIKENRKAQLRLDLARAELELLQLRNRHTLKEANQK